MQKESFKILLKISFYLSNLTNRFIEVTFLFSFLNAKTIFSRHPDIIDKIRYAGIEIYDHEISVHNLKESFK